MKTQDLSSLLITYYIVYYCNMHKLLISNKPYIVYFPCNSASIIQPKKIKLLWTT